MKRLIPLLLVFSLGGCATMPDGTKVFLPTASVNNPVGPGPLYDIQATYVIAQSGADAYIQRYRDGHRCTKTALESLSNLCSRRSIVIELQDADTKAQAALVRAIIFSRDNPKIDASSVISAAKLAVDAFYTIQKGKS